MSLLSVVYHENGKCGGRNKPMNAINEVQLTPLNRATSGPTLYVSNKRLELLPGALLSGVYCTLIRKSSLTSC